MSTQHEARSVMISAESVSSRSRLVELWQARDLVLLLVRRDFVTFYKQTVLGPIWFFLQPLLMTVVFTVVFGRIAKIPTDGVPPFLFYMSGIVLWTYFAACLDRTSKTFLENQAMFSKVYFPRLVMPLSLVITNVFSFGIQLASLLAFIIVFSLFGVALSFQWWMPLSTILMIGMAAALGIGCGLIIAAMTTRYRDLAFVVTFGVQLWMYATPLVYPLSQVPENWRWLVVLNPMATAIELFRFSCFGVGQPMLLELLLAVAITAAILLLGLTMFAKAEKNFIDTV